MDFGRIVSKAEKVMVELNDLWDHVGFPESVRTKHYVALQEKLESVMDTLLKDERIVRDEYTRKVYLYQQRTELLEDQLGIDHVCPPKSNLVTLFDLYSTRCDVLTKQKEERIAQIKTLLSELDTINEDIGESTTFVLKDTVSEAVFSEVKQLIESANIERFKRTKMVSGLQTKICAICNELGENGEGYIIARNNSMATIHELEANLKGLTEEKSRRQGELNDYLGRIKNLWDVLRVGTEARERFLGSRSGLSRELIHSVRVEMENLLEQKLARMKELNLTAQAQIESLWESLSVPETERRLHMEQYTGKFTEENYNALTALIATLEKKYAQAKPILEFIEQRQVLLHEAEELRKAAADPRRLLDKKHSATNLLNEEKIRKKIERTLPKIEENLFKYLSQWESEHGEPLLWRGNDYLAIMEEEREEAERTQKEAKMRKEMERASRLGMGPSSMGATPLRTPSKSERIIRPITPGKTPINASKSLREMSSIGKTPAKTPSKQVVSAAPTTPKSNMKKRIAPGACEKTPTSMAKRVKIPLSPVPTNILNDKGDN